MITSALDQIGGNTSSVDYSQVVQECATRTVQFVWTLAHQTISNANLLKNIESWKSAIDDVLRFQNSFVLTILNGRLYFDDAVQSKSDEAVPFFIRSCVDRRIRKLRFRRGITSEALECYASLMQTVPEDLKSAGGAEKFCVDNKTEGLTITEARSFPGEEPRPGRQYWERKLEDAGLDCDEIVALFSTRRRQPRMIAPEMLLIIEAMKNTQLLAQLLLRVAQNDPAQRVPDPAEVLRAAKRAQYLFLVHSALTDDEIAQILIKTFQGYDGPFRLSLYRAQLNLQSAGAEAFDDRFLSLQPQEYAEYIVRGRERDGDWRRYVEPIRLTPGEAMNISRAVEARLWTSSKIKIDAGQATAEIEDLERIMKRPLDCPIIAATDESLPPPVSPDQAEAALQPRAANFTNDLSDAYTNILLHLYFSALDSDWSRNLLQRLTVIVENRIEARRYAEVIALVRSICDERFGSERIAASKVRLREACRNAPTEALTKYLSEQITSGDQQLVGLIPEIVDLFGQEVFEKMVESLVSRETDLPSPIAVALLARHRKLMTSILTRLSDDANPWVRVRCYELLCTVRDPIAQDVALKGVADRNGSVRYLAYLALGKGASIRGIEQLLEVAAAKQKTGKIIVYKDCCAAITALGELRCRQAVPILHGLLKSKHMRQMPYYELKVCAARALRRIGTAESISILERELPDIDATAITVIGRRLTAPFRKIFGRRAHPASAPQVAPTLADAEVSAIAQPPAGEAP